MYVYTNIHTHTAPTRMGYTCACIYICIFMYTQIHTYAHTYIYIYTHTAPPRIGYAGAHILIHTHKCIYIHIHIYIYIYIYIYTHTAPPRMGYTCACLCWHESPVRAKCQRKIVVGVVGAVFCGLKAERIPPSRRVRAHRCVRRCGCGRDGVR